MNATQTALEQMKEYAAELRAYINRNQNTPVCAQQVADRRAELELVERRIQRMATDEGYIPAAIPAE